MSVEQWIVKKPCGQDWGVIKRLLIDSTTKQISYADVVVPDTGQTLRVPWASFHVNNTAIMLGVPEESIDMTAVYAARLELGGTVMMEMWP